MGTLAFSPFRDAVVSTLLTVAGGLEMAGILREWNHEVTALDWQREFSPPWGPDLMRWS